MEAIKTIDQRRAQTDAILQAFTDAVTAELGPDLKRVIDDHTTVYVTGSGGRGEMSRASDLDLFLVRVEGKPSRIDGALLQSAIVRATRRCDIEEPSADGVFLDMHSAERFDELFGTPDDDARNTFTPRMLLLLESRPVLGVAVYERLVERTIDRYWQNAARHESGYLPYIFINDVVRWWRVVLLNHEWKLKDKQKALEARSPVEAPQLMAAERSYRSYKLRFARCLTCFASLAYLLAHTRPREGHQPHVSREDMKKMVERTPFQRLEAIADMRPPAAAMTIVTRLRELYAEFLERSARPKDQLVEDFKDPTFARDHSAAGREFADNMFLLVSELGRNNSLYRYMVV